MDGPSVPFQNAKRVSKSRRHWLKRPLVERDVWITSNIPSEFRRRLIDVDSQVFLASDLPYFWTWEAVKACAERTCQKHRRDLYSDESGWSARAAAAFQTPMSRLI